MPERFARIYKAWRETHADWEITLYDAEAMRAVVEAQYPQYLAIYDAYPTWTHRGDVFRYCVLSAKGGVYADLDVEPLGRLDDLIGKTSIFLGTEPATHRHREGGLPYFFATAFMGSVAGHRFWDHVMSRLERCQGPDVVWTTGPGFLTGAALTADAEDRPDAVAPRCWSPTDASGKEVHDQPGFLDRIEKRFKVVGAGMEPIVSHLWFGSWMRVSPGYMEKHWLRAPSRLKWRLRERRHPELAALVDQFVTQPPDYDRQVNPLAPNEAVDLVLALTVNRAVADPKGFVRRLMALDLPGALNGVVIAASADPSAQSSARSIEATLRDEGLTVNWIDLEQEADSRLAAFEAADKALEGGSSLAGCVLLIDAGCVDMPVTLVRELLSARRDVVAPCIVLEGSDELDAGNARFGRPPDFRFHYSNRRRGGVIAEEADDHRKVLGTNKTLDVLPLDSVSPKCLLVMSDALRQTGARFSGPAVAGTAGGLGFVQKLLRGQGSVAGMPNVVVTHAGP